MLKFTKQKFFIINFIVFRVCDETGEVKKVQLIFRLFFFAEKILGHINSKITKGSHSLCLWLSNKNIHLFRSKSFFFSLYFKQFSNLMN